MKTTVIVPVYNEKSRVVKTISEILKNFAGKVIVVDDGSRDGSFLLLKKKFGKNTRVVLLKHIINLGKGAAMKTGAEMAWKIGENAVIFIDADGQHNPKYLKIFEKGLDNFPIVFGYRELGQEMPLVRKWGNILAANLIRVLFGIKKRDLLSGYLGFRKEVYKKIKWNSQRYGIETEMATKIGKNKIPFSEIKIDTIYIDKYKGVSIIDAIKVLIQIPFWYFSK